MDLYEHEYVRNEKTYSRFMCVHNDSFGREKTLNELKELLKDVGVYWSINPISTNESGKVNVFILAIEGQYSDGEVELPQDVTALDDVYYYSIIPCNYNPIMEG